MEGDWEEDREEFPRNETAVDWEMGDLEEILKNY
jgi:hypothetical protein